jgi:hypothetical protein
VDGRKGLPYWEDTLRVKNGSEIEDKLVDFINQMVKMFAFFTSILTSNSSC